MGEQNEASAQEKTIEGKRVDSVDHRLLRGASKEELGRRANGVVAFFLEASPERLQVIRKTIERVEKMTPRTQKHASEVETLGESATARTKMMKDFHMRQDLLNHIGKLWTKQESVK